LLTFADGGWHVFFSLVIFLTGLAGAFIQKRVFQVPQKQAIALYLWHTFFCFFYFWYTLNNLSDSISYYLRSFESGLRFDFGTVGIRYIVSIFTQSFDLSYGNIFLIFNIIGYVGLLSFASALQTVTLSSRSDIKSISIWFTFLPGLSFWSSAIGKDAVTFMGAGLVTWAIINVFRRWPAIILGTACFLIPRPHMAGIVLLSLSLALLLSSNIGAAKRIALLIAALPVSLIAVQFGLVYAGLGDANNLSDVNDYFESRQGSNLGGGSSVDIAGMPVPIRMFTYLFRPLIFDAHGALGLIVSIENLALLALFFAVIFRTKRTKSTLGRFEFFFYLTFVLISWFILSNSTANLGIAIRQKIMFLPMLVVVLFSIWQGKSKQPAGKARKS